MGRRICDACGKEKDILRGKIGHKIIDLNNFKLYLPS